MVCNNLGSVHSTQSFEMQYVYVSLKMYRVCSIITLIICACNCEDGTQLEVKATSKTYLQLSSDYFHLSSMNYYYFEDLSCADFYRSFIPHTENTLIGVKNFTDDFKQNNYFYSAVMQGFYFSNDWQKEIANILEPLGLKLVDRKSCTFAYVEKPNNNPDATKQSAENSPAPAKKTKPELPTKCEKFIAFFNVLSHSPLNSMKDKNLRRWKLWLDKTVMEYKCAHPLLAQRMMEAYYWSHKFHHSPQKTTISTDYAEAAHMLFNCHKKIPDSASLYQGTDTWVPPMHQDFSEFTPPMESPTQESALNSEEKRLNQYFGDVIKQFKKDGVKSS